MSELIKIYCIDDSEGNHIIGKSSLVNADEYTVSFFETGEECLSAAQSNPPDLVLLGTETIDSDGYEACKKTRESKQLSHIPVIFVSKDASIESKLHSCAVGGDDYVVIPYLEGELSAKAAIKRKNALDKSRKEVSDENTVGSLILQQEERPDPFSFCNYKISFDGHLM